MALLLFKKEFFQAIRAGRKVTTIVGGPARACGPGGRAFCPGLGWLPIQSVNPIALVDLDDRDALADGFETKAALLDVLRMFCPSQTEDGRAWFRVRFGIEEAGKTGTTKLNEDGEGRMTNDQ